ncbi:F-box family protein [Striga asiatica]|uniref:F-box family protein n=1 Tax=Striga asiatica TaxID=4170 RepID=A0A5A7REB3_STRAF|nr:F-box family protein [Striga asiatica]
MTNSSNEDPFERLPDDVVLSIFDRLQDARSLCLSMAVCTRFRAIAPQVFHISLPVPRRKPTPPKQPHRRTASLQSLIAGALTRPIQFISRMIRPVSRDAAEKIGDLEYYSRRLPGLILPRFHQIRTLRLRLPCNGYHKPDPKPSKSGGHEALLKWTADFGREIRGCVVLGARRWFPVGRGPSGPSETEARSLGDDELKLRIVWTISCLIAASARHYLVQETVRGLERVERVEVTDESGQGRLWMGFKEAHGG